MQGHGQREHGSQGERGVLVNLPQRRSLAGQIVNSHITDSFKTNYYLQLDSRNRTDTLFSLEERSSLCIQPSSPLLADQSQLTEQRLG